MQVKKVLYVSVGIFIFTCLTGFGILLKNDYKNYEIDKYNFQQLEKVKIILDKTSKDTKNIFTLKEFNEEYNAGIEPIKNCYYVSNNNGKYPYIFGFKLESIFYKMRYFKNYYSYYKYDLPYKQICAGGCYDRNKSNFEYIISNPCKE